ncbi:MAG: phosphate transporter rane protein 1, PhoT family [Bacteroidetes bacterium]|nr:phosphate transporter rane protein 1, PhoT family [Bacteroidota bacterium]
MFKKKRNRFVETLVEWALRLSGGTTTLVILLISIFLFTEGWGLFKSSTVEKGYVLCVNRSNKIKNLTPKQIKEIFDGNITSWKQVGGNDIPIEPLRMDDIASQYTEEEIGANFEHLPQKLSEAIASRPGALAFFSEQFININFQGRVLPAETITLKEYFGGKEWFPTATPAAQFGVLPLILGTLWVSIAAILIALPFGMAVAIYLAEIANSRIRKILKPLIELLAGIPSVVYGFFGLIVIVPLIRSIFHLPVGETALAGAIVLAIMALPTIITVAEDAMRTTPLAMKESSLALGATHWQTIYRVVIPYASSGILAAIVLGIGRAIGETMAVLMVTGNAAVMPHSLTEPVRTIPATIAAELGESAMGSVQYQALFMLGAILFVLTLGISIWAEIIRKEPKVQ